jgi:hypothetical protein
MHTAISRHARTGSAIFSAPVFSAKENREDILIKYYIEVCIYKLTIGLGGHERGTKEKEQKDIYIDIYCLVL